MERDDPAYPGQAHYTPSFLRVYDPLVLGLFCRWIWRCPSSRPLMQYRRLVGQRHLDVGPGTGWFLERTPLPDKATVTLMDPNTDVLRCAAQRLEHVQTASLEHDVLKPLHGAGPFDSIGCNYVLHCLPGPMSRKAVAIRNLAALLDRNGVLFGATVLGTAQRHTPQSRLALWINNRQGIFDNTTDTAEALMLILSETFDDVDMSIVGSVALFAGRWNPSATPTPERMELPSP